MIAIGLANLNTCMAATLAHGCSRSAAMHGRLNGPGRRKHLREHDCRYCSMKASGGMAAGESQPCPQARTLRGDTDNRRPTTGVGRQGDSEQGESNA